MDKVKRLRRVRRVRARIDGRRLQVHRTPRHIYAQIIEVDGTILTQASSLDKQLRQSISGDKSNRAAQVGKAIAERAKQAGVTKVAFDRSGFKYHGRIKALADAAREAGLDF